MATIAVFIALGGSSYAAIQITGKDVKDNSLTGADIKNNSVRAADIRAGAVKSSDVGNGTLLSEDFKSGQLPTGAAGPKGDTGSAGPQGPKGDTGTVDPSGFYSKPESDARYLAAGGKAADADRLDGVDSTGVVQGPGSPAMWSYRRDWARSNILVNDLPDIAGLGQLSFTCQPPTTTGHGFLSFRNTSSSTVESFATTTTAAGSTLVQLTTAPAATTTLDLGTGASQVVWQFGHLTYFNPGPLATVTASHVTDVTQCRISAMAFYQDPRRF
jgi:hypothetical protein